MNNSNVDCPALLLLYIHDEREYVECMMDTAFGSGLFVNRVPADKEANEGRIDGYMCPECQQTECDICGDMTFKYENVADDFWACDGCA